MYLNQVLTDKIWLVLMIVVGLVLIGTGLPRYRDPSRHSPGRLFAWSILSAYQKSRRFDEQMEKDAEFRERMIRLDGSLAIVTGTIMLATALVGLLLVV